MEYVEILRDYSLASYNTFGLATSADRYFRLSRKNQLEHGLAELDRSERHLILGGGSNLLFVGDYLGTVVHIALKGREVVERDKNSIYVKFGAGENWHQAVLFCVENGWGGIENLSLIPGTVGGAPIQNIGAYGTEFRDVLHQLETIEPGSGTARIFSESDCLFGYRDSVFKRKNRKFLILSVTLKLSLEPTCMIRHETVRQYLKQTGLREPSIKDISEAVIAIRRRKLPDPAVLGNAGSFFKNPVLSADSFKELRENHPGVPGYALSETKIKVPAGWLIEQLGWKERCLGKPCGVHESQALVIVNHGSASGRDILNLADDIARSVEDRFGIVLEREVQVIE